MPTAVRAALESRLSFKQPDEGDPPGNDAQLSTGQPRPRILRRIRLDTDDAGAPGSLHDELREPVEQTALGLLVGFLAVGITVADTQQRTFALDLEVDEIARRRYGPAGTVEDLHAHQGDVFAVSLYFRAVGSELECGGSTVVSRVAVSRTLLPLRPRASMTPGSYRTFHAR